MNQSSPAVSGMLPTAFVLNNGNTKNQPGRYSATGRYRSLSCETKAGPHKSRTLASPVGSPSRVKRLWPPWAARPSLARPESQIRVPGRRKHGQQNPPTPKKNPFPWDAEIPQSQRWSPFQLRYREATVVTGRKRQFWASS